MRDLSQLKAHELLTLHGQVMEELRSRGIIRSANNPTGDLAEHLFCAAFGWTPTAKSHPAADATDTDGLLYQIKARRLTKQNTSRQAGALRALPEGGFHYLAGVLFDANYTVLRAAIIPHAVVQEHAHYVAHTNSWKFYLRDAAWTWPGVVDATDHLRRVTL